jgi:hypothetical protein
MSFSSPSTMPTPTSRQEMRDKNNNHYTSFIYRTGYPKTLKKLLPRRESSLGFIVLRHLLVILHLVRVLIVHIFVTT